MNLDKTLYRTGENQDEFSTVKKDESRCYL